MKNHQWSRKIENGGKTDALKTLEAEIVSLSPKMRSCCKKRKSIALLKNVAKRPNALQYRLLVVTETQCEIVLLFQEILLRFSLSFSKCKEINTEPFLVSARSIFLKQV